MDAAKYLGISTRTLTEYRKSAKIRFFKLGNAKSSTCLYDIKDLDRFVEKNNVW